MVDVHEPEKKLDNDVERSAESEISIGNETRISSSESSRESISKDELPTGLTLWMLDGSVMIAIFLIALD